MAIRHHIEARRSKSNPPMQFVSETHHHKPDAPSSSPRDPLPPGVCYATDNSKHTRNHPAAKASVMPPATSPIPQSVTIWNVEGTASVSVRKSGTVIFEIRLQNELWESIGRPNRVNITSTDLRGIKIEWGDRYAVQLGSIGLRRISIAANVLGITDGVKRKAVRIKAFSRNGVIELAEVPAPWIACDPLFTPTTTQKQKPKEARLSANPQNGFTANKANGNGTHHAPPAAPALQLPTGTSPLPKQDSTGYTKTDLARVRLKHALEQVDACRKELEIATGMKFKIVNGKSGLMFVAEI